MKKLRIWKAVGIFSILCIHMTGTASEPVSEAKAGMQDLVQLHSAFNEHAAFKDHFDACRQKYQPTSDGRHQLAAVISLLMLPLQNTKGAWEQADELIHSENMYRKASRAAIDIAFSGAYYVALNYSSSLTTHEISDLWCISKEALDWVEKAYAASLAVLEQDHIENFTPLHTFLEKTNRGTALYENSYIRFVRGIITGIDEVKILEAESDISATNVDASQKMALTIGMYSWGPLPLEAIWALSSDEINALSSKMHSYILEELSKKIHMEEISVRNYGSRDVLLTSELASAENELHKHDSSLEMYTEFRTVYEEKLRQDLSPEMAHFYKEKFVEAKAEEERLLEERPSILQNIAEHQVRLAHHQETESNQIQALRMENSHASEYEYQLFLLWESKRRGENLHSLQALLESSAFQ